MTRAPRLGILDWGIGGLGVLRALRRRARHLPVLYVSDAGFTPYGLVSQGALILRVSRIVQWMQERGATHVVIACNAASTVIGEIERGSQFGVPLTGVIEPTLARIPGGLRGIVGVLGGVRTIRSGLYLRGLARPDRRIVQRIAQPLSAHVEAGRAAEKSCSNDLDRILRPLRSATAVVLACTHYPVLTPWIRERLPRTELIDPAEAVVDQLLTNGCLPSQDGPDRVVTTGDARRTRIVARHAWGFDPGRCESVRIA